MHSELIVVGAAIYTAYVYLVFGVSVPIVCCNLSIF